VKVDLLDELRHAVDRRAHLLEAADREVDDWMMRAYRAKREDGTPQFTLGEIGAALGVSRQRVYQLVRKAAAQAESARAGTRRAARGA
jgi:DNA-directed RNA polymerase specialized sigma subunit